MFWEGSRVLVEDCVEEGCERARPQQQTGAQRRVLQQQRSRNGRLRNRVRRQVLQRHDSCRQFITFRDMKAAAAELNFWIAGLA